MQLMAGNIETSTGCGERTVELIAGICHTVLGKGGFKTAFIKRPVVGYKRKSLYQRLYLCPNLREGWLTVRITACETVNLGCPVCIIVGRRLDERVELIDYLATTHYHNADAAYA